MISRKRSPSLVRAHLRQQVLLHPENPKKILQILLQTIRPTLVNARHRSPYARTSAPVSAWPPPFRKSQEILQILLQTTSPTLIISRHLSSYARTSAPVPAWPRHSENPKKSCKSCFRQSAQHSQTLANSHNLSSYARTSAPVPAWPPPSRKSQQILQILLQTIRPTLANSHNLSQSLVQLKTDLLRLHHQNALHLTIPCS